MSSAAVAEQLVERLAKAIDRGQLEQADGEIENLADMVVGALVYGNRTVTAALYPAVERLYAQHKVGNEPSDWSRTVSGQLRALTTVLSVAVRRRRAADGTELARDPKYQPLLEMLLEANAPMMNQDLAQRLGVAEETVARNIPPLRAAGLVTTTKAWKRKLNALSSSGEEAIRAVQAESVRGGYYDIDGNIEHPLQSLSRGLAKLVASPTNEIASAELVSIKGEPNRDIEHLMEHYREIDVKVTKEQESEAKISIELKVA